MLAKILGGILGIVCGLGVAFVALVIVDDALDMWEG